MKPPEMELLMWQRCGWFALVLAACKGGSEATDERPGVETRSVTVCVDGDATVGVAQFVLSDVDGNAIPASETTVTQTMDGDPPTSGKWEGGESLDEENLESDLHVTLLVDASASLAASAQFDTMKDAAVDLLTAGEDLWYGRPGLFDWRILWFNDWVWEAADDWELTDIPSIPGPGEDANGFTRMYAGIDHAIDQADTLRKAGTADGDLDNHLLVVFTDGQDNSSGRDSPEVPFASGMTDTEAEYTVHATTAITLNETINLIEDANPWLRTSLLALGDDVDTEVIDDFAEAGKGTVFAADKIDTLFTDATKSFETVQYVGWRLPLTAGESHKWKVEFKVEGLPKVATADLTVERKANDKACE